MVRAEDYMLVCKICKESRHLCFFYQKRPLGSICSDCCRIKWKKNKENRSVKNVEPCMSYLNARQRSLLRKK